MSDEIKYKELPEMEACLEMALKICRGLMTPDNKPSRKGGLTAEQKLNAIKHRNKIVFKNK